MNNPRLLALITIAIWSFGTYFGRLIAMQSQFVMLFLSSLFSLMMLAAFFFIARRNQNDPPPIKIKTSYLLFGPLGYCIYNIGLNQSLRAFNSASEPTLLNYTWPLFTIIFTHLIFQRQEQRSVAYRFVQNLGITLGFLAVVVLATEGNILALNLSNTAGITWGLLAGSSYGLFSAYSGTVPKEHNALFLIVANIISLIVLGVLSVSELDVLENMGIREWALTFVSGGVLGGLGYISWTRANQLAHDLHIDISSIASMMFALPVLSLIVIAILLGESSITRPFFLVSLLLLLLSTLLCQRTDKLVAWLAPST